MSEITFRYNRAPTGELSGASMVEQTEQALSEISRESSQAVTDAAEAKRIAQIAETHASEAQTAATTAQETATAAGTAAATAQATATQAVSTAQGAQAAAQGAAQTATAAAQSAANAQTAAENAATAAQQSEAKADQAVQTAGQAVQTAGQAVTTASNAVTRAEQAETNVQNAVSAAQAAQTAAAQSAASAAELADPNRYSAKTTALTLSAGQTLNISDLNNPNVAVGNKIIDALGNIFEIASMDETAQTVTLVAADPDATPPTTGFWKNPSFPVPKSAAAHNCLFRGVDLSQKYTIADLSALVQAGDFSDIYIGDYYPMSVTIDRTAYSLTFRVADFDYFVHSGDTETTAHHIVFVPDEVIMANRVSMNDSNTTAGGFAGSKAWTTIIPMITTGLQNAFGSSHVLKHRRQLTKSVSTSAASMAGAGWTGSATGWAWYDAYACFLNEIMVYGSAVFSSSAFDVADGNHQFALFRLAKEYVSKPRVGWWLSAVASSTDFAYASDYGGAASLAASSAVSWVGARPYFLFS